MPDHVFQNQGHPGECVQVAPGDSSQHSNLQQPEARGNAGPNFEKHELLHRDGSEVDCRAL